MVLIRCDAPGCLSDMFTACDLCFSGKSVAGLGLDLFQSNIVFQALGRRFHKQKARRDQIKFTRARLRRPVLIEVEVLVIGLEPKTRPVAMTG
jgi:hypothetical protein